jgi:hypothetical protein
MKRKQFIFAAISLTVLSGSLLTGCGKKGGEEYLGTWEDKDRHSSTMTIERNGDGYLINMASKQTSSNGQRRTGSVPATLKDGVLNYPNGPVTGTVTYVKSNDSVLVSTFAGTLPFVRVK